MSYRSPDLHQHVVANITFDFVFEIFIVEFVNLSRHGFGKGLAMYHDPTRVISLRSTDNRRIRFVTECFHVDQVLRIPGSNLDLIRVISVVNRVKTARCKQPHFLFSILYVIRFFSVQIPSDGATASK